MDGALTDPGFWGGLACVLVGLWLMWRLFKALSGWE